MVIPSSQVTTGYRDAPLILASVSRSWCDIATSYPPLWSTIFIDQLEDECLERILLFLDRSGKELLDIILLDPVTPTADLRDILMKHSHRFKTLVGLSAKPPFAPEHRSRIEPFETSATFVNWCIYASRRRKISTVPIPKCLNRVQLHRWHFDARSLVQFTYFHNLESLCIPVVLEPEDTEWDKNLRFECLRHLRLHISNIHWPWGSIVESPWVEWLECPVLVDLNLFYALNHYPPKGMYTLLETSLLRFRSLQKLRVYMGFSNSMNDK